MHVILFACGLFANQFDLGFGFIFFLSPAPTFQSSRRSAFETFIKRGNFLHFYHVPHFFYFNLDGIRNRSIKFAERLAQV